MNCLSLIKIKIWQQTYFLVLLVQPIISQYFITLHYYTLFIHSILHFIPLYTSFIHITHFSSDLYCQLYIIILDTSWFLWKNNMVIKYKFYRIHFRKKILNFLPCVVIKILICKKLHWIIRYTYDHHEIKITRK